MAELARIVETSFTERTSKYSSLYSNTSPKGRKEAMLLFTLKSMELTSVPKYGFSSISLVLAWVIFLLDVIFISFGIKIYLYC
ncbi:hypothetical protein MNB_SV-14-145 [hydrothermal vent metagenome]|uniref:Uncharacterized protein n=1 Tax=hydrothermal vent metagenome TaxID=652676 RepID=A0A1W1C8S1_9ZZZZ